MGGNNEGASDPVGGRQRRRRNADDARTKKNNISNTIVVARDGVEALDYLFGTGQDAERDTSAQPELILLDLKLPKVDGFEC